MCECVVGETILTSLITSCVTSDNYLISLSLSCIIYKMKMIKVRSLQGSKERTGVKPLADFLERSPVFKECYIRLIQPHLFTTPNFLTPSLPFFLNNRAGPGRTGGTLEIIWPNILTSRVGDTTPRMCRRLDQGVLGVGSELRLDPGLWTPIPGLSLSRMPQSFQFRLM